VKTFTVSYDLRKPGRDYTRLLARLRELGGVRPLLSYWVLQGDYSAAALRDDLVTHMDANDAILVLDVPSQSWAWKNLLVDIKVPLGLA